MLAGHFYTSDAHNPISGDPVLFRNKEWNDVYLTIDQNYVVFYRHRYNLTEESTVNMGLDESYELFALPLTINTYRDDLTSVIKDIFYESESLLWPVSKVNSGYNWNSVVTGTEFYLKRKLFLDFIFDTRHSSIFQASKWLDEALGALHGNFLFAAIEAKAEYYFCRDSYKLAKSKFRDNPNILFSYSRRLIKAERDWLNIIRHEDAIDYFPGSNWIKSAEEEYEQVLFWENQRKPLGIDWNVLKFFRTLIIPKYDEREKWIRDQQNSLARPKKTDVCRTENEKIERVSIASTKWFLKRYKIMHAFRAALQLQHISVSNKFTPLYFLIVLVVAIWLGLHTFSTGYLTCILSICYLVVIGFILMFVFRLMFYFHELFRTDNVKPHLSAYLNVLSPRLFVAVLSSSMVLLGSEDYWKNLFDIPLDKSLLIFFFLSFIILAFLYVEIKNIAKDEYRHLLGRVLSVFSMAMVYALLINTIGIGLYSKSSITRSNFLKDYYVHSVFPLDTQVRKCIHEPNYPLFEDEKKYLSRLGISSLSIDDEWGRKYYFRGEKDSVLGAIDFTGESFSEIPTQVRDELMFYLLSDYKNPDFLVECLNVRVMYWGELRLESNHFRFYIFPGFLIATMALSMFTGIFIQLIFEDKAVTEPL